jgi:hypothetical protein
MLLQCWRAIFFDSDTATKGLDRCDEYFMPNSVIFNMRSCPNLHGHASPSNTDVKNAVDQGGNTALHCTAIYVTFEAVDYLLKNGADALYNNYEHDGHDNPRYRSFVLSINIALSTTHYYRLSKGIP